jgi:hypothetical protein
MCYYYDGDGVCEDFERETGVRDCGLYTPSGFLDQWAATVEVSHELKPYCSGEVAAGYPAVTKVTLLLYTLSITRPNPDGVLLPRPFQPMALAFVKLHLLLLTKIRKMLKSVILIRLSSMHLMICPRWT